MNTNKIIVMGTIVISLLLLTIPTIYKVIKNHEKHLYEVVESKITIMAEQCYYDQKCPNDKITLKELYENNYLEAMSDPITKEYYNEDSYVLKENKNFKFVAVE